MKPTQCFLAGRKRIQLGFSGLKAEKCISDSASWGKSSESQQVTPSRGAPGQAATIWASQLTRPLLIRRPVEAAASNK